MCAEERLALYPLRQSLLPGAEALAIFAQRGTVDWLSRPDRYLIVCEGRGGRIYAANECALTEAQEVIRDVHGALVVLRRPEVHSLRDSDGAWVEPLMFLRLKAPSAYTGLIVEDLERRGVKIEERDLQRHDVVVRAEGWLQDLMGYPQALRKLTNGSATSWIWLLRYATRNAWKAAPDPPVALRSTD
ncbi:hypothetical protein AB4Z46_21955 [Variovorax sp. M-6]|uniref:hypothetical protein n=1 Tax=Variovorax sp. M-6 TaxID=3233041 RepID=UPI003F997432